METAQIYAQLRAQVALTEYETLMYESLCNFINGWNQLQQIHIEISTLDAKNSLKEKEKENQKKLEDACDSRPNPNDDEPS